MQYLMLIYQDDARMKAATREEQAALGKLLYDSRRDARVSAARDIVLLEDQDRARRDRAEIDEGLALVGNEPEHRFLEGRLAAAAAAARTVSE